MTGTVTTFRSAILLLTIFILGTPIVKAGDNEMMEKFGMVDAGALVPEAVVSLVYATDSNFTGVKIYHTLTRAYLHPLAAESLAKAQAELSRLHPGYRLKIYDAARPIGAQRLMYETVKGTSKARYVSNPRNGGGLHNYGMAVDITITDSKGNELDMGTIVDFLGPKAGMAAEPTLTKTQRANRRLLRQVMTAGGFTPLKSEWWHFNRCTRRYARTHYKLLDF